MLERYFTPYHPGTAVRGERVAILAPHPDDEVFGCGASAAKWAEQGLLVQVFILTAGVLRGEFGEGVEAEQKCAAKASMREQESREAAQMLGLPVPIFLQRQDGELLDDTEVKQMLWSQLEAWQPTTLVLPSVWEMHRDHRATAQLGLELAVGLASVEQVACYEVGVPLVPNVLEDISALQERKWQAMHCFTSQLDEQHYAAQTRGLNSFRSYTLGLDVTHAEAFHCLSCTELEVFMQAQAPGHTTLALQTAAQQRQQDKACMEQQQELIAQQQARILASEQLLSQTHQTFSWRITKPLRWLSARRKR